MATDEIKNGTRAIRGSRIAEQEFSDLSALVEGRKVMLKKLQAERNRLIKQLFSVCYATNFRQSEIAVEFTLNHLRIIEVTLHGADERTELLGLCVNFDDDIGFIYAQIEIKDMWMSWDFESGRVVKQHRHLLKVINQIKQIK